MIKHFVADLPEVYQPIYGHPELSHHVSRTSLNRFEHIARIHDAMQRMLSRPLRVLDLGCAQGYFSLNLAERGATVHGVDYLEKNVALCNAIARENTSLAVSFEVGRIEDIIGRLVPGQYDLVLGLSVFHHIVHEKGVAVVQDLLGLAAEKSGALVLELALREEPLYWSASQPEDPRSLLASIPFVHEVARHGTHLANIARPLLVASSQYWILNGQASHFHSWTMDPHALANGVYQSSRRYFFGQDQIVKQYRLDHVLGEANLSHFSRETEFLKNPSTGFLAAKLIHCDSNEKEAWVVMQRLPGRLLLDLLREKTALNTHALLLTVLEQLTCLEAAGLFHDDVRTWNVLVADDGAVHLIDYGSISPVAKDCVWPVNPFFSFFIFLQEVVNREIDDPDPLRSIAISPLRLPPQYQAWASALWCIPMAKWSFRLMYQSLLNGSENSNCYPSTSSPQDFWMQVIEEAIEAQKKLSQHIRSGLRAVQTELRTSGETLTANSAVAKEAISMAYQAVTSSAHSSSVAQQALSSADRTISIAQHAIAAADHASSVAQQVQIDVTQARDKIVALEATLHSLQHSLAIRDQRVSDLLNSTSWRVTAPLRWLSSGIRRAITTLSRALKFLVRSLLLPPMRFVLGQPRLRLRLSAALKRFPTIAHHLHLMAINRGLVQPHAAPTFPTVLNTPTTDSSFESGSSLTTKPFSQSNIPLTPRANRILDDLMTAIERNRQASKE
ncbi:methyltransferase domain-containing protein [Hydrogenophaga flava]|uniref:methyltransferase domain-containing protein n=1 Tax=Hydrogenophaga flava TaxID=65657 RepID=UPI000A04C169|nr:methyltransferase domain-containing protein [Hydrogenophaga flava]